MRSGDLLSVALQLRLSQAVIANVALPEQEVKLRPTVWNWSGGHMGGHSAVGTVEPSSAIVRSINLRGAVDTPYSSQVADRLQLADQQLGA